MSFEREYLSETTQGRSTRRTVELIGIGLSAVLGVTMFTFIIADWLRFAPIDSVATTSQTVFDNLLIIGGLIDFVLQTQVFYTTFSMRSLATGVLIGIVAPVVGTFLVHRQMALIGETLAHTAFAGVAAGVVFSGFTGWEGSWIYAALIVSVLGAVGLQWLTSHTKSYGDVPIAIVLSGSFAVGTLLISWGRDFAPIAVDIEGFLFGSLAIVTTDGARLVAFLTVGVIGLVIISYKQFLYITFDEQAAKVSGINVNFYNILLIAMTAVVVVGAMQILGVILVAAMLVVPVAAASQVSKSFRETLYLSVIIGQVSTIAGILFANYHSLPPGGSIVVIAIGIYLACVVISSYLAGRSVLIQQY